MIAEIKDILYRNRDTLVGDALGAVALFVMLFVGLSLPGVV